MQEGMGRIYFMDSMRSTLMMLGVVLHSAQVFNPEASWLIHHENSSVIARFLVELIHAFRMQAFFVISGFFCFLTYRKYGGAAFLRARLPRIIIPLFVTAITLNSLQVFLLSNEGLYEFHLQKYFERGDYISHLWFLVNLVVYFVVVNLTASYFPKVISVVAAVIDVLLTKTSFIIVLLIMPLFSIFILSLNKIGVPLYADIAGVISIVELLLYVPYFIFGLALAMNKRFLNDFCCVNPFISIIVIISSTFVLHYMDWFNTLFGTDYLGYQLT
jgi:glucan biosynthesis protein C